MPKKEKDKYSEDDLQKACMKFLRGVERMTHSMFAFHVPNGGKRNYFEAVKFKAMGVRAGVPDIIILQNSRTHFIELKQGKTPLSDHQKTMRDIILKFNFTWDLVRADKPKEAVDQIESILIREGILR